MSFLLKTFEMLFLIFMVTFQSCFIWLTFLRLFSIYDPNNPDWETFANSNFLQGNLEESPVRQSIIMFYFSFTSLTTVGFGDFHPLNDIERLFCAFFLVFGVSIFSYIMGVFIEMLDRFKKYNDDYDDSA